MHIAQLETFLAVTKTGNYRMAADMLNVTQAAVSARVLQLEDILGVRLFDRGRKGAELTEAGRSLLPTAELITKTWRSTRQDMSQRYSGRIQLRFGAQLSIWDEQLIELLVLVEQSLGKLPLNLNFDHDVNMQAAIRDGLIDLALTFEAAEKGLSAVALTPERLVLVADKPAAFGDANLPLFLNFQLGPQYDQFIRAVIDPSSVQHFFMGNCVLGIQYLRQRGGMAYAPETMVRADIESGQLFEVQGAPDLNIPCNAVFDPEAFNRDLVAQVVQELRNVRGEA